MKAVSYRWGSLQKEEKLPFERAAQSDRKRYERDNIDLKKGEFHRNKTSDRGNIRSDPEAQKAFEITEEIKAYLNIQCQGKL